VGALSTDVVVAALASSANAALPANADWPETSVPPSVEAHAESAATSSNAANLRG